MAPGKHCHYQSELAWLLVSTVITRVNWHGSWWALSLWGSTGMDRTSQHHNPRLMAAHTPTTMSTQTSGGTHTPLDTNAQRHSHLNWSLPAGRGWHSSSGGRCRYRHSDPAQSASCTTNTACIRHSVHLTTSHSTPLLIHQTTSTSHSTPLLIHQTTSTSHSTPLLIHQTTSTSHHFSSIKPHPLPTAHPFSSIKPPPTTSHPSNHLPPLLIHQTTPTSYSTPLPIHQTTPTSYSTPLLIHQTTPTSYSTPLLIHQTTPTSYSTPLLIHQTTSTSHHFSSIKPPPPPTTSHPSNHTYFLQHTPSHPSNHTYFLQHTPSHLSVILNCTHFIHMNYIKACSTQFLMPHMHFFLPCIT